MASDTKTLRVVVVGDSTKGQRAVKDFGKSAEAAAEKAGKLGKHMSELQKLIGAEFAVEGLFKVGEFFVESVKGAEEAEKATKVLNSQIKNLGPSGRAAFKDATKFAADFGASIGVDDDAIKPIEAKLASFPDAFKKGSLGAEGMKRSIKAAFDLQAIGIGSAESNIIGIGKAMNDPIKGMAALNKSGVSFTAEQKKQITNYVKHGRLAKAQSILLKGIESNAKGAAAAAASPMQKMKTALDNAGESIAGLLIPQLKKFADLISMKILPKISELAEKLGPRISAGLNMAGKAMVRLYTALGNPLVQKFILALVALVAGMKLYAATVWVVEKATKAWEVVQAILDGEFAVSPIGLIVVGLALLTAGVIYAYKHFKWFRDTVQSTWAAIKTATNVTVAFFQTYVWPALKTIFHDIGFAVKVLWTIFTVEFNLIRAVVMGVVRFFMAYVWPVLKIYFGMIAILVKGLWLVVSTVFNNVRNKISAVVNWFRGTAWPIVQTAINLMRAGIQALWDKWRPTFDAIKAKVEAVMKGVKAAFTSAKDEIGKQWSKLQDLAKKPVNFIINTVYNKGIRAFWNAIATKVGAKALPALAGLAKGGGVPSLPGVVGDWVPLYGQAGEYMLNRKQVAKAGGWRGVEGLFGPAGRGGASGGHYDSGGIIGGIKNAGHWLADKGSSLIRGSLLNIAGPLINTIKALINQIPGTGDIPNLVRGLPTKALDSLLAWIKPKDVQQGEGTWNGTIQPGIIGAMQKWALAQAGKRYLWAAVGPNSYDCSGLVGNLWAMATGNPLYRRYMTTSSMGAGRYGMVSGPGAFTVYLSRSGGHTAANVGGLHAEAYGGNGTPNAIGRIGTSLSYYQEKLHLPGLAAGGTLHDKRARLDSFVQRGWPEPPAGINVPRGFHPLGAAWLNQSYDSGGILRPGTTLARNNTGRNEYVMTGEQLGGITVNVTVQGNVTTEKELAESIATTVRDALLRKAARNGGKTGLK
jgi:hypothetical protein